MWCLLSKANTELLRQEITVYYQSCADRSNKEWVFAAVLWRLHPICFFFVFCFFICILTYVFQGVRSRALIAWQSSSLTEEGAGCKTCSAFTAHLTVETTSNTSQPVNCKATYKIKLVLRNLLICFNKPVRVLWLITANFFVLSVLLLFYIGCFFWVHFHLIAYTARHSTLKPLSPVVKGPSNHNCVLKRLFVFGKKKIHE